MFELLLNLVVNSCLDLFLDGFGVVFILSVSLAFFKQQVKHLNDVTVINSIIIFNLELELLEKLSFVDLLQELYFLRSSIFLCMIDFDCKSQKNNEQQDVADNLTFHIMWFVVIHSSIDLQLNIRVDWNCELQTKLELRDE